MGLNLEIFIPRNSDNVHLKLTVDYDGSFAYELLDVMRTNSFKASRAYMRIESLKHIEPPERKVFQKDLDAVKTNRIGFCSRETTLRS
jgi:hypothetical protein